jgi:hypothetical protein
MLDMLLGKVTEPALAAVARRFPLGAPALAFASFAVGLAALPAIALHYYFPGLALVLISRPFSGLAAATGRQQDETPAYVSVFDAVVFAGIPFAFALADPYRALASVFVMFGLAAQLSSAIVYRQAFGLIGNFEILIAVAIACVFPDRFAIIAYVLGVLCFVAAGVRVAAGIAQRRAS